VRDLGDRLLRRGSIVWKVRPSRLAPLAVDQQQVLTAGELAAGRQLSGGW